LSIALTGDAVLNYGKFITAILNFLIMALIVFSMIKMLNAASAKMTKKKEEEPAAPTTKVCPYCKSEIPVDAVRCPHCTSVLEGEIKEIK
jgi:large conductance mechanosensitive channel